MRTTTATISGLFIVLLIGLIFSCTNHDTTSNYITTSAFPAGNYANRASDAVLSSPHVEGVIISVRWRDLETAKEEYAWSDLDGKIGRVVSAGKKVVLNIMASGVNVPEWLIEDPDVKTFEFVDTSPYHPTYGQILRAPIYWDEKYLNEKQKLVNGLGKKYANNSAVAGVVVSFVGTINNDWYIPKDKYAKGDGLTEQELLNKGYSTDKMLEAGEKQLICGQMRSQSKF